MSIPILAILQDTRSKIFNDLVIAILESSIHDGPAYFNCYPNYSMDLRNPPTKRALALNIGTLGTIVDEGTTCLTAIYRVHCKVSITDYSFKALRASLKIETGVLETNLKKSKLITPKRLKHSEALAKCQKNGN